MGGGGIAVRIAITKLLALGQGDKWEEQNPCHVREKIETARVDPGNAIVGSRF